MEDLVVSGMTIPAAELEETFLTSGGPGGQHANRNETAVRLRFDVSASTLPDDARQRIHSRLGDVVEVTASESRSQFRNRAIARRRLVEKIEQALRPAPKRRRTKPTRASKRRRVADKRARGDVKRLRRNPTLDD